MYIIPRGQYITVELLEEFLQTHDADCVRFKELWDAYNTVYPIFSQPKKPRYKPDNRIAVNFAKYITDTMNGFFMGIPVKVTADDEQAANYVDKLNAYNGQDDNNAELSKMCSIYGKGYEMYYVDDEGEIAIVNISPMSAFMIYDDSIIHRPRYFVHRYTNSEGDLCGSISDDMEAYYFNASKGNWFFDNKPHGFDGVPATEYAENAEEIGIFEPVLTMINAYNKALSEKANDVDYFADAYLKILGTRLDEESMNELRSNRTINFEGVDADKMVVEFLKKPDGDATQEHLIERLERLIYQISMVANISDESFGASSGIALQYKLLAMSNLAKTKERKFTAGLNRRYKLIFSNPVSGMRAEDWVTLDYKFTQNIPANLLEESQIAGNLAGITSKYTQLKTLSIVDSVDKELERIDEDMDKEGYDTDYPTERA